MSTAFISQLGIQLQKNDALFQNYISQWVKREREDIDNNFRY